MDSSFKSEKEDSANEDDNLENFMTIDSVGDVDGKSFFHCYVGIIVSVFPEYHTFVILGVKRDVQYIPEIRGCCDYLFAILTFFFGNSFILI